MTLRILKYTLLAMFAVTTTYSCKVYAYLVDELPINSTSYITLENQPIDYDINNPPQIEVSMFADFSDSVVGNFLFVIWDREDLLTAQNRLGLEFPEIPQLNKYVSFGISQYNKPRDYAALQAAVSTAQATGGPVYDPNEVSISWGWKYARLVTDVTTEQCSSVDYYANSNTTKSQLLGVIKQFDNLVSNGNDAGKVLRSVADLYGKVDEVKNELSVLKTIVSDTE